MVSEASESVGRSLQQLFSGGGAAGLTDEQLLERLSTGRREVAEAALSALLSRHGPMVLATCRRVLGDHHAAEDAFQATFLVLVRQAGTLRVRESLGPWLHGVATRTALKARTGAARRQARELRVAVPEASPARDAGADDLGAVLHAEVARLPAKYRDPVVLCYFEGRTHDEAAVTLRWPLGTVRGRLSRARDLLRSRLTRRGLAPAGLLGATLPGPDARAEVAAPLRDATLGVAIRGAPIGAGVAMLTRHVLRSLLMAKVKLTGAMVVAGALLATGVVIVAQSVPAAQRPPGPDPAPAAVIRPEPAPAPAVDRSGDPLPPNALARMGTIRFHNGQLVNQVIYTPDGKSLFTVGWDHLIHVWDAASGRILRDIGDPEADVQEIAMAPDGKMLLTVENPGLLRLWDFDSGRERRRSSPASRVSYSRPAYSPDGKTLATSVNKYIEATKKNEAYVALWDAATLTERHRIGGDWLQLWGLTFSPDGKMLATATYDTQSNIVGAKPAKGSTRLWDVATGKELRRFPVEGFYVRSVAFAPDGKRLAAGITDRTIRVYDLATGEERAPRLGREHALPPNPPRDDVPGMSNAPRVMTCLAFAPDGSILASGPEAPEVKGMFGLASIHLWDVATGKELRQIPAHQQWVNSLSFAPDGKTLASTGAEPIVRLWDVASGREVFPQSGHRTRVRPMAVSPADGTVLTGGYDGTVRRWDPATGRELGVVATIDTPVDVLALAPDGRSFVIGTSAMGGPITLWDLAGRREVRRFPRIQPRNPIRHVAFAPDGKTVASEYRVWDVATGNVLVQFRAEDERVIHNANFFPVFYTPDSKRLITVENDGVRIWDIATGKESSRPIRGKLHNFWHTALSPDGRLLATENLVPRYNGAPAPDTPIRVWELASGREVATLDGHTEQVRRLAFSPDVRLLASASGNDRSPKDRTVRIWDVATGRELRSFEGHLGAVNAVAFAPDGRSVISGSEDATALTWDISDLRADPLDLKEIEARWGELAGDDAPAAHRAAWALSVAPAVPFLRDHLPPAAPADPARITTLITDLNSVRYATRTQAAAELERLGAAAAPALRRALAGRPSAEVRGQAERLLAALEGPVTSPEVLRRLRAIAALERVATPEAREVLELLARGDPEARETVEAQAALDRPGRRPGGR